MFKLYVIINKESRIALLDLEEKLFKAAANRSYDRNMEINNNAYLVDDPWIE